MKVFSDPLYRKSFLIMLSTFVGGVINYLFNPLAARLLRPAQYGELLAMLAVVNIIAVPASTVSIVTTQFVSRYQAFSDQNALGRFVARMYRSATAIGVLFVLIFACLVPFIMRFFHFSSSAPLLILSISIITAFIYPVAQGVIQGRQQFFKLSAINVIGSVLRIVGIGVAIAFGFQLTGIVGLLCAGSCILLLFAYSWARVERPQQHHTVQIPSLRELFRNGAYVLLTNVGLALLLNIDLFITKRYLSPDLAGQYGTISLLGKAIFYFGGSLALVLFPMVLVKHAKNESSSSIVVKALAAITLITIGEVLIFVLCGPLIIRLLFGTQYLNFSSVLWLAGIVFGLYSAIHILVTYFLATPTRRYLFPLLGGCVMIPLIFAVGPHTVYYLMYVMMATFATVVFLLLFLLKSARMKKDQPIPITEVEPTL